DGSDAVRVQHVDRVPEPVGAGLEVGRRRVARDEADRAFLQAAEWLTVRRAVDDAVLRVRRPGIDAGDLERPAVDPGGMPVRRRQHDGAIGYDAIQNLLARVRAGTEYRHRPPAAEDPFLVRVLARVRFDRLEVFLQCRQPVQVAGTGLHAAAD